MDLMQNDRRPGRISYPEVRGRRAVDSPFLIKTPGDKNLTTFSDPVPEAMLHPQRRPVSAPGLNYLETPIW